MADDVRNVWFPFGGVRSDDEPVCFCFHHAGGSAAAFRNWARMPGLRFVPVELAGRGMRIREKPVSDFGLLLDALGMELSRWAANRPFYLFGHSMGALLAFAAADILEHRYGCVAQKLVVAGRHAPQDDLPSEFKSSMGIQALETELVRVGGTPQAVLDNRELMDFMLPMIMMDYQLIESYVYNGAVISAPIVAHGGDRDPDAGAALMLRWQGVTHGTFRYSAFSGDHFFLHQMGPAYPERLRLDLLSGN